MNTKTLSDKALAVADQYLHFHYAGMSAAIPYYNNNHKAVRAGLRATLGKGSPRDILDEIEIAAAKEHRAFVPGAANSDTLKHFLVDQNIGIDCSGLAYYVLNAESLARGKGTLDRHLTFPFAKGFLRKYIVKFRPIENTDVVTLASDENSRIVTMNDIHPGDFIAMTSPPQVGTLKGASAASPKKEPDHILIVHHVDYQNFVPTAIYYINSVAWPTDGLYDHGVREGKIEILDPKKSLLEQRWIEAGKTGIANSSPANEQSENYAFSRAQKSTTVARRLNWF